MDNNQSSIPEIPGVNRPFEEFLPDLPTENLSRGQKAMGVSFNPSKLPEVDRIKNLSANLCDELMDLRDKAESGDVKRYYSKAISALEDAQMNAVRAATWQY